VLWSSSWSAKSITFIVWKNSASVPECPSRCSNRGFLASCESLTKSSVFVTRICSTSSFDPDSPFARSNHLTTLANAKVGQSGRILRVEGVDDVAIRLLEMGLTPGVDFEMLGKAPLGDPIEIEIRGYRLSLRKSEAARISIELKA
jgi:Fe2+ transport system protein FeoA